MLVVCHLCIFLEYCIKGALINSVKVCIIYYTCTGKILFIRELHIAVEFYNKMVAFISVYTVGSLLLFIVGTCISNISVAFYISTE